MQMNNVVVVIIIVVVDAREKDENSDGRLHSINSGPGPVLVGRSAGGVTTVEATAAAATTSCSYTCCAFMFCMFVRGPVVGLIREQLT